MGFSEDDRIRHKNAHINKAYNIYTEMRSKLWCNADIAKHAQKLLIANPNDKVYNEVFKIANFEYNKKKTKSV